MNVQKRLQRIKDLLIEKKLDSILISSTSNIFYLSGYAGFSDVEREAYLLVTQKNLFLFTDARYTEAVKTTPHLILKEITAATPLLSILEEIVKSEQITCIGFESNNLTVSEHTHLKKKLPKLTPLSLEKLREEKDADEILEIERACIIGDKAFEYLVKYIKPGISEKELATELEIYIKKQGADTSFRSIIAFGKNAAIPHHLTSDQKLATRDIVLLDFGVKINGYCSDMTRTVFFGKTNDKQKKMYNAVLEAQTKAFELLVKKCHSELGSESTVKSSEVDHVARKYIVEQQFPSIPHSLGHGIGIEVHEAPSLSPKSKDALKPGMVFSLEPGIYIPDFGGIRIEDLVVIDNDGPHYLTHAPKQLIEL